MSGFKAELPVISISLSKRYIYFVTKHRLFVLLPSIALKFVCLFITDDAFIQVQKTMNEVDLAKIIPLRRLQG